MESAMETNKDAKVVSKKKQNIVYLEVQAISHIGKKKYGTDDFETFVYILFCFTNKEVPKLGNYIQSVLLKF